VSVVEAFGIRHHGPGSARALGRALADFEPEVVLIEGPPEADAIVRLAAEPGMVPPVALLAYLPGAAGRRAAFWPFAEFSPEWQAIRYASAAGVPVRFCDLPAAHQLAAGRSKTHKPVEGDRSANGGRAAAAGPTANGSSAADLAAGGPAADALETAEPVAIDEADADTAANADETDETDETDAGEVAVPDPVRLDPLGWLAQAAGYDDAERWWDDVIEHRRDGPSPFEAIAEAMTALREHAPAMPEAYTRREEQREAYMRRTLRRARKEGYERVAVVCGAWHVPAVTRQVPAAQDDRTLRGLPKVKVAITWVPWTHGRLASWSGYGAGVSSPGWYHHLFTEQDRPIERWLTEAARVLRDEDLPVSSAHVIEAVRLADALAALRDRPLPGLDEVTEATRSVLCEGAALPLELIQRRMVVGERLGSVPEGAPMVPLQRDLQREQRRLRLRPAALDKDYDLDLRKPGDLDRSRLLHRLRLLDVPWGVPGESAIRGKGTFRETWTLAWRPEFDVDLIEAGAWGTTVPGAATAKTRSLAAAAVAKPGALPELTSLAERCLLADLGDALPAVMRSLADQAATDTDVAHLMAAVPALVRALRYGDVRGTSTKPLRTMVDGLMVRIRVGLPPALAALDDDAARTLLERIDAMHAALALLGDDAHTERWRDTLADVIDRRGLHGLIEGRLTRLLLDAGRLTDVPERMARAVSVGQPPARTAAWVEGFLSGGGIVLVHDETLLRLVDDWIGGLPDDAFTTVLPLLRRTFGTYAEPERRAIGEQVSRLGRGAPTGRPGAGGRNGRTGPGGRAGDDLDAERAAPAVRAVIDILGWSGGREWTGEK
jgi:hypothetical protein